MQQRAVEDDRQICRFLMHLVVAPYVVRREDYLESVRVDSRGEVAHPDVVCVGARRGVGHWRGDLIGVVRAVWLSPLYQLRADDLLVRLFRWLPGRGAVRVGSWLAVQGLRVFPSLVGDPDLAVFPEESGRDE